ncbi:MAG: F-type H+-transporting ATPase subunit b [Paracoccaceae bacterium]|jgi:F-type H+-transporting ATPase subunit b
MSVDWITVAAQIVNFLILIWLLKRFLYKPILNGIDAREADIAARVAAADSALADAQAAGAAHRAALASQAAEKTAVMDAVRTDAADERARLSADADADAAAARTAWAAQMAQTRAAYAADLHDAGAEALAALTRKALRDLAGDALEDRVAIHLAARLGDLDGDLHAAALRADAGTAISSKPLSPDARAALDTAFHAAMPGLPISYAVDAAQSPGVVLRFGGGQVAWTLKAYLDRLDAELEARLTPGRHARRAQAPS